MMTGDRQRIIETNRSLRIIKNELETLLEKGVLDDAAYDNITSMLPTESSLSSVSIPTLGSQNRAQAPSPQPAQNLHAQPVLPIRKASPAAIAADPVSNPPPAYSQSPSQAHAAPSAPVPGLPPRKNTESPAEPEKPVLCKARALYKYAAQDARDCSFDKDDVIHVYEYMNADWWMGRNERTNAEGIFPRNYVQEIPDSQYPNEKAGAGAVAGYPAPPPQGAQVQNPYNNDAPPMAMANETDGKPNKGQEMGKKFGKKLGNAAIFGAGATMGSNLVNSIF
ncbi:hypothetical protein MKZ38_001258 [Zalerion maritima]|uniref:SH3 domain-containing protein n=1 Tax=Zalerion maritima TaxID=339359 RepID=A0AAD5WT82_9PEZI|nr:hypothetical protein MKZ38_001258 [Zalerion maritima]